MSEVKLTTKQRLFVEAYLGAANSNATEAARMAGYSGNENALSQRGHELVRNSKISELIEKKIESFGMSANDVLTELANIAKVDIKTLQINPAFKASDKIKALELIGKHFKLFTDKIESDAKVKVEVEFVNE